MDDFKDAIFMYETRDLPPELKVMDGIYEEFEVLPEKQTTLVQIAHTLEEAAPLIDEFKARSCGSPYSLAIINLNMFHTNELNFIMQPEVLGDPQTIFLASLKYMVGDAYALARDKSLRESDSIERSPSCVDCYGVHNRDSTYGRVAQLAAAYLREAEIRTQAKRRGQVPDTASAVEQLKKSQTTFFGKKMRSGIMPAVRVSGRFPRVE
jgi:hypothetical protein